MHAYLRERRAFLFGRRRQDPFEGEFSTVSVVSSFINAGEATLGDFTPDMHGLSRLGDSQRRVFERIRREERRRRRLRLAL